MLSTVPAVPAGEAGHKTTERNTAEADADECEGGEGEGEGKGRSGEGQGGKERVVPTRVGLLGW